MPLTADVLDKQFRPRFVPEDADFSDWSQVEPLYRALLDRPINTVSDLERWIEDWSELEAFISEGEARRYIDMTCHTDDPEKRQRYLKYCEEIVPKASEMAHQLKVRLLQLPQTTKLDPHRYTVLLRMIRNDVELFRTENIPLKVEEKRLATEYRTICGNMTVRFRDREHTLQQMARYFEEPDRSTRQEAWELVANRRFQEKDRFEKLFDQLLDVRKRIAQNAGFPNYLEYRFRELGRFDYGPEECIRFHQAVEKVVVPLVRELHEKRRELLGIASLRPWDTLVDPRQRPPLRPFETGTQLAEKAIRVFRRLDPRLGDLFEEIYRRGLLDLESRPGKAPGGYQYSLDASRLPFIFMNAAGLDRDVTTILHEAGHAFHALATREEPILAYRHAPIEFCEVASMGMELLASPFLDEFYNESDYPRRVRRHLEAIVHILPWIAQIDAFQHWIYTHPGHERRDRQQVWLTLDERFSPGIDWSGYEEIRASYWQRQLHLFEHPLYYIEYGIAQIGALGLWVRFRRDPEKALQDYLHALELGGSRPLPELFQAAGLPFDFSEKTLAPLIDEIRSELARLPD